MDSEDVQEFLDFHNQELTTDGLTEMHEQDIEKLESLDPVQSENQMTFGNSIESLSLIEKGLHKFWKIHTPTKGAFFSIM
ncbi:hypothetical protein TNCV_1381151 [Trichonephila clavipes]|nr:hypothetical protein TNCV_1381151 [Trichonephila clavipes]